MPSNVVELVIRAVDEASGPVQKIAGSFLGLGKLVAVLGGLQALRKLTDEIIEAQAASFQLANAVKLLGDQAEPAGAHFEALAREIQGYSTFSDNAVKSSTSLALRLGLTVETVERATRAAVDLAAANQEQLEPALQSVSRALADPERGLRGLRSAGVIFTQEQQFLIEKLSKTGEQAKAQDLILDVLEQTYRDAGREARQTLGGSLDALGNSFSSLFEASRETTRGLVTVINQLAGAVTDLNDALSGTLRPGQELSAVMKVVATAALVAKGAIELLFVAVRNELTEGRIEKLGKAIGAFAAASAQAWKGNAEAANEIIRQFNDDMREARERHDQETQRTVLDVARETVEKLKAVWDDAAREVGGSQDRALNPRARASGAGGGLSLDQLRAIDEALKAVRTDTAQLFNSTVDATGLEALDRMQQKLYESTLQAKLLTLGIKEFTPELRAALDELDAARQDNALGAALQNVRQLTYELELQAELGHQAGDAIEEYRAQLDLAAAGAKDLDDQLKQAFAEKRGASDQAVLTDLREQLVLEQLTTKEREKQENLRRLSSSASGSVKAEVAALTESLQVAREQTAQVQSLREAFIDMFQEVDSGVKGMLRSFLEALKQIVLRAAAVDLANLLGIGSSSSGGSSTGNLIRAVFRAFGFAAGGGDQDRPFIAGEEGEEVVVPGGNGARVYNQRQLAFAMGGGGGNVNYAPQYNVQIVAADAERTKAELVAYIEMRSQKDKVEMYRNLRRNGIEVRT